MLPSLTRHMVFDMKIRLFKILMNCCFALFANLLLNSNGFAFSETEKRITSLKLLTHAKASVHKHHNGRLLWKIEGYRQKMQDAITGKQTSIYSPPMYTSPFGYQFRAKLYLNGNGLGEETHLSLFFVLMKGQYDDFLPWPFQKKITMTLIDQANIGNATDTFFSDPFSTSFQKPESSMNIPMGIPTFLPLCSCCCMDSRQFIKDDTLYIQINVN